MVVFETDTALFVSWPCIEKKGVGIDEWVHGVLGVGQIV